MKKHKRLIIAAVFVCFIIILNNVLNFCLVQPGLARTIMHDSESGEYETIILGASHGSYGIDADIVSDKLGNDTINMCMGGEFMIDAYYVLKYALKNNKPKTVVLDVDYQYLVNRHDESILFNNVYNGYPDSVEKVEFFFARMAKEEYRGAFLRWTNYWQCYKYIPKTVAKKLSEDYKNFSASVVDMNKYDTYMGNGFVYRNSEYKKSTTSVISWDESKVASSEINYIKKIVKMCRDKGINIIFTTVTGDPYTLSEQKDKFKGADTYISNLASDLGVSYINLNYVKQSVFARTTDDFYDREGHMYGETAKRFSEVYGEILSKTIAGNYNKSDYLVDSLDELY